MYFFEVPISAISIPIIIKNAPEYWIDVKVSPLMKYAKKGADSGSTENIMAVFVGVVKRCIPIWIRKAIAVAKILVYKSEKTTYGVISNCKKGSLSIIAVIKDRIAIKKHCSAVKICMSYFLEYLSIKII